MSSTRGDQGFAQAYSAYNSDTFRVGFRVPILYMRATAGKAEDWRFDPDLGPLRLSSGSLLVDDWLQGVIDMAIAEQPADFIYLKWRCVGGCEWYCA